MNAYDIEHPGTISKEKNVIIILNLYRDDIRVKTRCIIGDKSFTSWIEKENIMSKDKNSSDGYSVLFIDTYENINPKTETIVIHIDHRLNNKSYIDKSLIANSDFSNFSEIEYIESILSTFLKKNNQKLELNWIE